MGYVPVMSLSSFLLLCLGLQSRDSQTSTMGHFAIIVQLLYNLDGLQFIESSPPAQNWTSLQTIIFSLLSTSPKEALLATCHHRIAACLMDSNLPPCSIPSPYHSCLQRSVSARLVLQRRTHIRVAPGSEEVASAVCNVAGTNDIGAC